MTKKITITLEEELVFALSQFAKGTGKKKTQIIREALKHYLPASKEEQILKWKNSNQDSIHSYNRRIKEEGSIHGAV